MSEAVSAVVDTTNAVLDTVGNASVEIAKVLNPYYPVGVDILNYAANEWSVPKLLTAFFGTCFALITATYFVTKATQPTIRRGELYTIMWFVISGAIHICFEGYYSYNHTNLGGSQTVLAQLWKEYAFSDSRYLTNDSFVLCMETVTAVFWGPGCLIAAWMVMVRHPLRYPVQLVVSMGQVYGDVLYYSTSMFDHYYAGVTFSRPEKFYFWFYFVFMNFIWIVIPGCEFFLYPSRPPKIQSLTVILRPDVREHRHFCEGNRRHAEIGGEQEEDVDGCGRIRGRHWKRRHGWSTIEWLVKRLARSTRDGTLQHLLQYTHEVM